MAYLTPANFREGTLSAECAGLTLAASEAPDNDLTTTIATVSRAIDRICDDFFEPTTTTLEHDVYTPSPRLFLLRRTTAVTAVKLRDYTAALTTQAATSYRLHSSLDVGGAVMLGLSDWLDLVPDSAGLVGPSVWDRFTWPVGPQTVQVSGTFGWTTTPGDIKRACALMVWDIFKREGGDVRRAQRWARGELTIERATDTLTGLPEADETLKVFRRTNKVHVG
jgi:hypothetical protein